MTDRFWPLLVLHFLSLSTRANQGAIHVDVMYGIGNCTFHVACALTVHKADYRDLLQVERKNKMLTSVVYLFCYLSATKKYCKVTLW